MFLEERHQKILEFLEKKGKVLVKDLGKTFQVTEGMIRKDLQRLEQAGFLERTYGGAIKKKELQVWETLSGRNAKNMQAKENIAKKAVELLKREMLTIFLDSSSTNLAIARKIAKTKIKCTIVTNMPLLMNVFEEESLCDLFIVGGKYEKKIGAITGFMVQEAIERYHLDIAFLGAAGINAEDGTVSNFDAEEAMVKKAIIKASKKVIVPLEKEKLSKNGSYKFAKLNEIDELIFEEKLEEDMQKKLQSYQLKIW